MADRARRIGWLPVVVLLVLGVLLLAGLNAVRQSVDQTLDGGIGELVAPASEIDNRGPVVVESIRALSELSTVEVVQSTTVEKGQDRGWLDWAAGDRIFLFAVASINAGVDLSEVGPGDVVIDEEANSIQLRLPAPKVTSIEVDNEQTRVYDRDTGVFAAGDQDLERSARLAAEEIMVDAALQEGLLDEAETNTRTALEEFLGATGFDDVEVTFDAPDPSRG